MRYTMPMIMKKFLPLALSFSLLAGASQSIAEDKSVEKQDTVSVQEETLSPFVELYTSQSCPRCPKANERFKEFALEQDIIAVTFPVDIWDYMGWKDTFAQEEFTARQKAINTHMGRRGPYTPQAVFNGEKHCSAVKKKPMERRLKDTRNARDEIKVQYDGAELSIAGNDKPLEVWIVDYTPGDTFETPKSGNNSNKTMLYHNRAIDLASAGTVEKSGGILQANCQDHCAIVFQEPAHGKVIGAIKYPNS